ncbi:hypothetical protein Acsp05_27200 [Actinokineospora sp. NBRC 105648]|nr:hypothetical protein Acsp05_27200 [Actinokineospora sp. NBRC 105648]
MCPAFRVPRHSFATTPAAQRPSRGIPSLADNDSAGADKALHEAVHMCFRAAGYDKTVTGLGHLLAIGGHRARLSG